MVTHYGPGFAQESIWCRTCRKTNFSIVQQGTQIDGRNRYVDSFGVNGIRAVAAVLHRVTLATSFCATSPHYKMPRIPRGLSR
jgi:hypothetical protein